MPEHSEAIPRWRREPVFGSASARVAAARAAQLDTTRVVASRPDGTSIAGMIMGVALGSRLQSEP